MRWRAVLNRLSKAKEGSGEQMKAFGNGDSDSRGGFDSIHRRSEGGSEILGVVPHMDGDRIHDFFGMRHGFPNIARLEHIIARVGVGAYCKSGFPVDVGPGGDLEREIAYRNHSSAKTYEEEVRGEMIAGFVRGRALVFPLEQAEDIRGLRIFVLTRILLYR